MPALPDNITELITSLPQDCGVYFFKSADGTTLYIGKAKNIKKRVQGHYRHYSRDASKEAKLLSQVSVIDYIRTASEAEALLLEAALVKEKMPKYNVLLKDDKSYPWLKITSDVYPRLVLVRRRKPDNALYFGPYTSSYLLKQALKLLRRQFPLRTCRTLPNKVCLMYHIGQCKGPCEGLQTSEDYAGIVHELAQFLDGKKEALIRSLTSRMAEFSKERQYEKAQLLYEQIRALSASPVGKGSLEGSSLTRAMMSALELPREPRRVEAFDISNIQETLPVASMVVSIDGKPRSSEYRLFKIKTISRIDDYAMMKEVVRRRYQKLLAEHKALPDLILIDGGKGHLAAAYDVLVDLGISDQPILSIAKEHEHIYKPNRQAPYVLALNSPILQSIASLRNEAHRFAISYHRKLRSKKQQVSILDEIPGLGPVRKKRLLNKYGSARGIANQTAEDLASSRIVDKKLAELICHTLKINRHNI